MDDPLPFPGALTDEAELRDHYRQPSALVTAKVRSELDAASRRFIARSPFVLVASAAADGMLDVSPRGGPPGFVRVLADGRLLLPDLNGNNLLDTYRNVVATARVGMLFVVPGLDETLRVNGRACITVDDALLAQATPPGWRTPKAVLGVAPDQVFVHCAKSFRRGGVWEPTTWASAAEAPDAVEILACQGLVHDPDGVRAHLEDGYAQELAADRA